MVFAVVFAATAVVEEASDFVIEMAQTYCVAEMVVEIAEIEVSLDLGEALAILNKHLIHSKNLF